MGTSLVRAVIEGSMSAWGQTETRALPRGMSVLPPGAEMCMTGRFAPEAVAGRVCSSQYRGALLRNRIVGLAFTQRLQRVEYNRDVDRLLKQNALNGHDIAERCGDHAEQ